MFSGFRFGNLVLAMSLMVACSDDEGVSRIPTAKKDSNQSSDSRPDTTSAKRPKAGGGLRGDSQSNRSFAGFGRVGRSHYSDADYRARWAVIVGVNRFKDEGLTQLDNAVNDARAVRDVLRDEFGFDQEHTIFLVDQERDTSGILADREPITKRRLLQAFEDMASRDIRSSDAVLFFFAGHGKSDAQGTFLAAHDSKNKDLSTWVDVGQLKEMLAGLDARHKLMILDSCYAGSMLEVDLSKEQSSGRSRAASAVSTESETSNQLKSHSRPIRNRGTEAMELHDSVNYYLQEPAFLAITSGRNQPVADASFIRPEHSPFTTTFLQILRERANSNRTGDVFTARELAVRVESQVRGQTPDWGRLDTGRGDFVFKPTRDRMTPREVAERDDYFIRINLAQIYADRGDMGRAFYALAHCDPKQRHYEWYRLRTIVDDSELVWSGGVGPVRVVVVASDGNAVLAGGDDGKIRLWVADKPGAPIATWMAHAGGVTALAISENRSTIVSGGVDKTVKIWDATSAESFLNPIIKMTSQPVKAVAISPNNTEIAYSTGEFDPTRGELRLLSPSAEGVLEGVFSKNEMLITTLAFSPDGKQIVAGSRKITGFDGEIKIWDVTNGKLHPTKLERSTENMAVGSVAWSSTGHIAAGNADGTVTVWDAHRGGKPLKTIKAHVGGVGSIAFSPDGKRILSCKDSSGSMLDSERLAKPENVFWIKMWDVDHVEGDAPLLALERHQKPITSLAFGPKGKHIFSSSFDSTVRKWPTKPFAKKTILAGHEDPIYAIAMSANGKQIASAAANSVKQMTGEIRLWHAESGKLLWTSPKQKKTVHAVALSNDGKHLASGSGDFFGDVGEVKLWNANKPADPLWAFPTREFEQVTSVAFSPDGKMMAAGTKRYSQDYQTLLGTLYLWNLDEPKIPVKRIESQQGGIETVVFSPDGKTVAFGKSDRQHGAVAFLDIASGRQSMPLPQLQNKELISKLVFSPSGKHIIARSFIPNVFGWVKIWDLQRRTQPVHTFNTMAESLAITSDGKRLITGSDADEGVQVWDAIRGGEALLTLREGRSPVAVSPNGKRIVSASEDRKSILIWNTKHWPK